MKKSGVLNHRLSDVIARMGHTQRLVVADAGLPIPPGVERIDLAVTAGLPGIINVARAIAAELHVEEIVIAAESVERDQSLADELREIFPSAAFSTVPHATFKVMCDEAVAIVRTGECVPYSNVILISGVTF
jgi:D-ribose pyranase